jgi:serine phosphatase RsbU (regulator of sigma subunit)
MEDASDQIQDLIAVNQIIEMLNRTVDMQSALDNTLGRLLEVMGMGTGWIFLRDPADQNLWAGRGYVLAAHKNLPPALALDNPEAWEKGCDCEGFCDKGKLVGAYNEVRCSRLVESTGERGGLLVHASAPLRSGEEVLGILNIAAADWSSFTPRLLAFLTHVGAHMGVALERARLYDLLRERRINEQRTLLSFSNQLLKRLELDELLNYLAVEVPRLLDAEGCAIVLHNPQPDGLPTVFLHQWPEANIPARSAQDVLAYWQAQAPCCLASAPLVVESGELGWLMLRSSEDKQLDDGETRLLQLLANQVALAIEKSRLHQVELSRQRMEAELETGMRLQRSLLPRHLPDFPAWEFAAFYQPAHSLGGDFYDFFNLPGVAQRLGMVIADVVDKGLPAALFMALCRSIFRTSSISESSPAEALQRANLLIRRDSGSDDEDPHDMGYFVSAVYAILDIGSGSVIFANAGHNRPLCLRSNGQVDELPCVGVVLGVFDDISLEQSHVNLAPGDSLLFFTDGITEAINEQGELFNTSRLVHLLENSAGLGPQVILDRVVTAVFDWLGPQPQSDDLTLFILRRKPAFSRAGRDVGH